MRELEAFRKNWLLLFLLMIGAGALFVLTTFGHGGEHAGSIVSVPVTGVHHLGEKFNIGEFYVDRYYASNVGRGGGGGSNVCCVNLPAKWRPGLTVEVRWSVNDWSHENRAQIEANNYDSVAGLSYIATVPVEQYDEPEHVWVHFFPGGKARVVSSMPGAGAPQHPIQNRDPYAINHATAGHQVNALFSKAELDELDRKRAEKKRKYGDWR